MVAVVWLVNRRGLLLQVNWTVMKEWVAKRVTELLGIEEEVLISMIHNHLIDQVGLPLYVMY
jgi:serine/arginine repetitive matrix protein 1